MNIKFNPNEKKVEILDFEKEDNIIVNGEKIKVEIKENNIPKIGDMYWYINDKEIKLKDQWCDDRNDKLRYRINNCFLTEKECDDEIEKRSVLRDIRKFANENNKDINLQMKVRNKYYIIYDIISQVKKNKTSLSMGYHWGIYNPELIYFISQELCEQAIELYGERYFKYVVCNRR